jgi:hypothetical protein
VEVRRRGICISPSINPFAGFKGKALKDKRRKYCQSSVEVASCDYCDGLIALCRTAGLSGVDFRVIQQGNRENDASHTDERHRYRGPGNIEAAER